MKAISTHAIIEGVRARKDRSLGLTITTPELSPTEKALFMELQGINLEMVVTPTDEQNVEDYKINSDIEQKKPSVRMRNVLFILWNQTDKSVSFDDYYRSKMESIIEQLKSKIEQKYD